jgi:hypothetical protein
MRPNKSAYLVASLTFTLLPPRIARVLVLAVALLCGGLAYWVGHSDNVVFGQATEVLPLVASNRTLVAVTQLSRNPEALLVPDAAGGADIQADDIVLAYGADRNLAGAGRFFDVGQLGVLPVSQYRAIVADIWGKARVTRTNPIGIALAASLIVLFAGLLLRLGAAAILGPVTGLATFVLLQINIREVIVPIPSEQTDTLLVAGAVIGAVIGFKALIGDPYRLGERVVAVIFALPLVHLVVAELPDAGVLPWSLVALAALAPMATPILAALLMVIHGLALDGTETFVVLVAMIGVRLLAFHRQSRPRAATASAPETFTPQTDERGAFDLAQIFQTNQDG